MLRLRTRGDTLRGHCKKEGGGGGDIVSCARRGRGWGSGNIVLRPGSVPRQGVSGVLSCPKGVKGGVAALFLHVPGQAAIGL